MTTTTVADLSTEDLHAAVAQLTKRLAEIAAERDLAIKLAAEATKDLVRVRDKLIARDTKTAELLDRNAALITSNRRLTAHVRKLALANEELQRQRDQNRPGPVRRSWWSGRIGNRL